MSKLKPRSACTAEELADRIANEAIVVGTIWAAMSALPHAFSDVRPGDDEGNCMTFKPQMMKSRYRITVEIIDDEPF